MFNRLFATRKRPYIPHRHEREHVEIDLSGNVLSLDLLPHSNTEGFGSRPLLKKVNIFSTQDYQSDEHVPEWQREGDSTCVLHQRDWDLLGPFWVQHILGTVECTLAAIRLDLMPAGMSCFNPQHFEQVVLRAAYYRGPTQPEMTKVKSPINWQVINKNQGNWIYYEIHPDLSDDDGTPYAGTPAHITSSLFIPIEDRQYLTVNFRYLGYAPVEPCLKNMDELRDSVRASIDLKLSSTSQKQLTLAKQQWPNAKVQENRQPEPWVYPKWRRPDHTKGESDIVILQLGSPAPEFTP